MDFNAERQKAFGSIRATKQFVSKETDTNDLHSWKHKEPMHSTVRGIVIDCRAEPANAFDAIRFIWVPFSNDIEARDLHEQKQTERRVSMDLEIKTD
jgi:hypothetical protein